MTFKSFLDISNFKYNFEHSNWMDWERVAKSLPELLNSGIIRKVIDNLPRVELEGLEEGAIKRAYTILTFIVHAYIRGISQEEVIKVKIIEKNIIFNIIFNIIRNYRKRFRVFGLRREICWEFRQLQLTPPLFFTISSTKVN